MRVGMALLQLNILHILVNLVFGALVILLFVRMILSWLPFLGPGNPVVRFVNNLTDPLLDPVRKRITSMSAGVFDISVTIAFIFAIWALFTLSFFIQLALPSGW
jgi:YggT family protein